MKISFPDLKATDKRTIEHLAAEVQDFKEKDQTKDQQFQTGAAPIEAIAMVRVIRYLKKNEQMEEGIWPKVVLNDVLCKTKKTWMQQNKKWFSKWGIFLSMCPTNSKR